MFLDDSYEVIHIYSTGNTFLGKNLTTLIVRTGIFKIQPEVILKNHLVHGPASCPRFFF